MSRKRTQKECKVEDGRSPNVYLQRLPILLDTLTFWLDRFPFSRTEKSETVQLAVRIASGFIGPFDGFACSSSRYQAKKLVFDSPTRFSAGLIFLLSRQKSIPLSLSEIAATCRLPNRILRADVSILAQSCPEHLQKDKDVLAYA